MPLNAFKDGVTPLSEATLNPQLSLQPFDVIYEGTKRDSKEGSGVVENSLATYNYCMRFTANSTTEVARIELHLDKDGTGSDVTIEIRSGMSPASGADGTLLKRITIPKEWVSTSATYFSIPIALSGLSSGSQYWIVVKRAGDSTNKCDLVGESLQDSSYPAYRRSGDTGTWTLTNALHFKVYSGASGMPLHVIEGENMITTIQYSSGLPAKIMQYLPPSDGTEGGIREVLNVSYSSGLPVRGV